MNVGIHQPHYFPWMGYFDKMAKSDKFILLDDVQMEKGSYMYRNRIINAQGKISFLTISGDKHGYLGKKYRDIETVNDQVWLQKQSNMLWQSYKDSPYYDSVWSIISPLFSSTERTICSYCVRSIRAIKELLEINTELLYQSELCVDDSKKKNDLVLSLCQAVSADRYISGNGARKYTDEDSFNSAGIELQYQVFQQPEYPQLHTSEFIPGVSMLDMLFNLGIDNTKEIFWKTINS